MGVAEEDQGRLALEVLVGNGLAVLVGELELAADRGRLRHLADPTHGPEQDQEADDEACGEGGRDHQGTGGGTHAWRTSCRGQKQAVKPVLIISKNTWVP